jgi:hypothetical protein
MPQARPIYVVRAAQRFREIIRPDMFGKIGRVEPPIAMRAATELNNWLFEVVRETLAHSEIKSRKGEIRKQLLGGVRVFGRASLAQLRGQINVQPWIFAHEYGGEIGGKGKLLTIPFGYALRADGSPKFASANSWRRFGSFIKRDKINDRLFIVYKAANGELRYLYTLVEEVHIPARLHLNRMGDNMLGGLMAAWGQIYIQEVGKLPGLFEQWLEGFR